MAPTFPIEFAGQKESKSLSFSRTMGKSRKYSKGHSTGFVPDYRHIVETVAESEGFGSTARVDTEMTASEDSYAPKRKCVSLNADYYKSCGFSMQVLSLSKMSRTERKDLKFRLKIELEQVQSLQLKLRSLSSNLDTLSPTSNIRSSSAGQKRPLETITASSELLGSQGKKRATGSNGSRMKTGAPRHSEKDNITVHTSTTNAMLMKQCETLLNRMLSHPHGWVFKSPVDVVKLNIPDYFTVIKHPMDFGTVKSKIASGEYSSPLGFAEDVRLTFSNALTYNPRGNDVHIMAEILSKYFEMRWKAIEKKLPATEQPTLLSKGITHSDVMNDTRTLPSNKKKITSDDCRVEPDPVQQKITNEEKTKLSQELETLLGELPDSIIDFLREHSYGDNQTGEDDEIEIDIDALSDEILFNLRKLLDDYLAEKRKSQVRVVPFEMEIVKESGLSNLSMQAVKGNDLVDEDVDIVGGNDAPISSYLPVEIEKDAARRNSKCSSSSSSTSESGSSSSDSGDSSGNGSDTAKASVPFSNNKDKSGSGANKDQTTGAAGVAESLNGLNQVEVASQVKSIAVQADDHLVGESGILERQVSPEKLYRAALLRNRFADTILKAREKALEKGEKQDPEKLRIEKEELEKRRREEKARLQAEALAAEEGRRKAEAEAVAEAKRKRELDREASRLALQKMEKTVDIDENSFGMEDENGLGTFKMEGSNPLEQLGLYMKMDDEEEEESEAAERPPKTVNEVEDK